MLCESKLFLLLSRILVVLRGLPNGVFWSTLLYNAISTKLRSLAWYNRVDDKVILGGLPLKFIVEKLKHDENIGGVVSMNTVHELDHWWVAKESDWRAAGVRYFWLPVGDYLYAPKAADIARAVSFIDGVGREGKTTYVHCKAGRTRSAMVVICYLIKKYDMHAKCALELLKQKRPQLWFSPTHWLAVEEFRRHASAVK